jgi:hypothetical protein
MANQHTQSKTKGAGDQEINNHENKIAEKAAKKEVSSVKQPET